MNDASGNGLIGKSLMSTEYVDGYVGKAFSVKDHPQNAVSIPHQVLDKASNFTITSYVKLNGFNSNNNLLTAANSQQADEFILGYNDQNDQYQKGWHILLNNVTYQISSELTLSDKKWHHVTLSRGGTILKLFVDGNQVGADITVSDKTLNIAPKGLVVGQDQDCVGGCLQNNQNWDGLIDELCFFRKALSQDEIKKMSNEIDVVTSSIKNTTNNPTTIYPNPTTGIAQISSQATSIKVYSNIGQQVLELSLSNSNTINLANLENGIYYVSLLDEEGNITETQRISVVK